MRKQCLRNQSRINMQIYLHQNDLPSDLNFLSENFKGEVAVDTEAMGLRTERDRLCLIQISEGNGDCHLVQFSSENLSSLKIPNLKKLFENPKVLKIFHFARFDVAIIKRYLNITVEPLFCTKIASKLVRTYTDRHGLKDLCKFFLNIDISKEQQCSDWGKSVLTQEQLSYAALDVLYLHKLKEALTLLLIREGRMELAKGCFAFLPTLATLDAQGFDANEIIQH